MSHLQKRLKDIMGQETTTVFTVIVKHKGLRKDFSNLFRANKFVKSITEKTVKSSTIKTAINKKYSDDEKILRALWKQVCEHVGLKSTTGILAFGYYKLGYGASRKWHMPNGGVCIDFKSKRIECGFTSKSGFVSCKKYVLISGSNSWNTSYEDPPEVICLADPSSFDSMVKIVKECNATPPCAIADRK